MSVAFVRHHTTGVDTTTATTTVSATLVTANVPIGNVLVTWISFNNSTGTTPTVLNFSRMTGETNNWFRIARHNSSDIASNSGVISEMWAIKTSIIWTSGISVTATISESKAVKTLLLSEFSGVEVVVRGVVGSGTSTGSVPTASTSGTALVTGDLILGAASFEYDGAIIEDSDLINGSWSAGSVITSGLGTTYSICAILQYKIITATGVQTYNPVHSTTTDSGAVVAALVSSVPQDTMGITRIGPAASATATNATQTVPYPQVPTAGNLLLLTVMISGSSPYCPTPAGWTLGVTGSAGSSTLTVLYMFWKIAVGNDTQPTLVMTDASGGMCVLMEEWTGFDTAQPFDVVSTVGQNNQQNSLAGNANSGPITTVNANDWIWTACAVEQSTSAAAKGLTWAGGSYSDAYVKNGAFVNNYIATGVQSVSVSGTYQPLILFPEDNNLWTSSATASIAFRRLVVQAGDVTAVPAVARGLGASGILTGIGQSITAVAGVARGLPGVAKALSAVIVDGVSAASRVLAPSAQPSAGWTMQAVSAVAFALKGGPIDIFWNGLLAKVGFAHTGAVPPTITAYTAPASPVYTVEQYRARFLSPQVNITRRVEILEADGSTLWDDKFGNKKRLISGSVSVDYTRDERRSCDLELANFDGALVHKPDGFWYDKVLRLFRGIEFYDQSGLRSYEVTLGTFMIDRVVQARFPKTVKITARDFTKKCMLSKFGQATAFAAGTSIETVIAAIASNAGIHDRVFPVTGKVLGVDTFFERGTPRWEAMKKIAEAFGYELFFNAQAFLIMRLFIDPTLGAVSHEFKTGPSTGNLVDWGKSTNDTRIFNHISISGTDSNTIPVWAEALNNNSSSPTRIAKLGDRVYPYESAFVTTVSQAQALADSYLKIYGLEEYEVSLTSISAPWLEAGEIIRFTDPNAPPSDPDRFLMTSFTIPMDLSPMTAIGRRVTIVS